MWRTFPSYHHSCGSTSGWTNGGALLHESIAGFRLHSSKYLLLIAWFTSHLERSISKSWCRDRHSCKGNTSHSSLMNSGNGWELGLVFIYFCNCNSTNAVVAHICARNSIPLGAVHARTDCEYTLSRLGTTAIKKSLCLLNYSIRKVHGLVFSKYQT